MIITSSKAVRWIAKLDQESRNALQTGRRRLAITISNYEPPKGTSIFVVGIVPTKGKSSQEIDRFGIHPNQAFSVAGGATPHRFLISLVDHASLLDAAELVLEVGFDPALIHANGGSAEIAMELIDVESN